MNSEGSCDTKDLSNDAENSAITGINYILIYSSQHAKLKLKMYKFDHFKCWLLYIEIEKL